MQRLKDIPIKSTFKALIVCVVLLALVHFGCRYSLKQNQLDFLYALRLFVFPLIFIALFLVLLLVYQLIRYWWKQRD